MSRKQCGSMCGISLAFNTDVQNEWISTEREREIRRVVRVVFRGTSRFGKKTVSLRSSHNAYLEEA